MSDIPQNLTQSYDPSVAMSGDTALLQLFKTFQTELNICIPCIVEEVKEDGRVKVKPLMKNKWSTADGAVDIDRPSFTVPCIKYLHGGFFVQGPISKGDTGWVIAGDRDPVNAITSNSSIVVDGKTDNKGPVALTSLQMNQFAFGFFIPDSWAKLPKTYEDLKNNFTIGNVTNDDATTCYLTIDEKGECRIHAQKIDFIFNQRGLTIDGTRHDVFIDPDGDLPSSDARFREVSIIKNIETREGTTYIKYQKARVLVDDGDEIEEIPISGGGDIDVGNTTTGEPGTNASVEKRIEEGKVILDFTIPRGSQGENGNAAGFGTPSAAANTLPAGALATATVVASGPDTAKVFRFTFGIPKGDKGDKGDPGEGSGVTEDFYFIGDVKYEGHTLYKRVDTFDHNTGQVVQGQYVAFAVAEAI